ncbi:hypothetical protein H6P81_006606 [Aristolochia fimbriata]|uniref:Uncharacterized protein n=1 Tax=Aristolochia fimbriata TaxID=158543 RepID=A0AAV7F188_ARIFI|nr:hypothetical protein H6P81_006606 [Aristolochia fimbriata]
MEQKGEDRVLCQTRCLPYPFKDKFDSLDIPPQYVEAIKSTPFGHLLNISTQCIDRAILDFIVQNWDVDRCGVSYLGRFLHFRPEDVAPLVLGLKCKVAMWTSTMMVVILMITRGCTGMRIYMCPVQEIFLREQELLVAPHGSSAQSSHESEHSRERISYLEAELANFKSNVEDRFKVMESRFPSPLTMHPHYASTLFKPQC